MPLSPLNHSAPPPKLLLLAAAVLAGTLLVSSCTDGMDPTATAANHSELVRSVGGLAAFTLTAGDSVAWDLHGVLEVEDAGEILKYVRSGPTNAWDVFHYYEDNVYKGRIDVTWSAGDIFAIRVYDPRLFTSAHLSDFAFHS
jgi:hypothetical protein